MIQLIVMSIPMHYTEHGIALSPEAKGASMHKTARAVRKWQTLVQSAVEVIGACGSHAVVDNKAASPRIGIRPHNQRDFIAASMEEFCGFRRQSKTSDVDLLVQGIVSGHKAEDTCMKASAAVYHKTGVLIFAHPSSAAKPDLPVEPVSKFLKRLRRAKFK